MRVLLRVLLRVCVAGWRCVWFFVCVCVLCRTAGSFAQVMHVAFRARFPLDLIPRMAPNMTQEEESLISLLYRQVCARARVSLSLSA